MPLDNAATSQDDALPPLNRVRLCHDCRRWDFLPPGAPPPPVEIECAACGGALIQPDQSTYKFYVSLWGETRRELSRQYAVSFSLAQVIEIVRLRGFRETQQQEERVEERIDVQRERRRQIARRIQGLLTRCVHLRRRLWLS